MKMLIVPAEAPAVIRFGDEWSDAEIYEAVVDTAPNGGKVTREQALRMAEIIREEMGKMYAAPLLAVIKCMDELGLEIEGQDMDVEP